MRTILALLLLLFATSCATQRPKSMEEARARVEAAVRHGCITKDDAGGTLAQFASAKLPEKSAKPLDSKRIEERAAANAAKLGNFARFNQQYSNGTISKSQHTALVMQEQQARALAEQERKLRRAQAALAIASAMNAASASMAAANAQTYSTPYTPAPIYSPSPVFAPTPLYTPRSTLGSYSANRYDPDSLSNPYGAGSPYKADGLMNPYSQYGSRYSNKSWTNPYATDAPKIYSEDGTYHGRLSTNKYDPDSTSNPYGRYGSKYSSESINNPYGAGNPYSGTKYYVAPQR
jgi:hypothetical protein